MATCWDRERFPPVIAPAKAPPLPAKSGQLVVPHCARLVDLEQAAMRRSGAVNSVRESDPEGQLLGSADRVEHDRQSRMRRRPRAKPTETIGIAGHNDPVLGDRAGEISASEAPRSPSSWTCTASKPCAVRR
jgi:hypothetical protein